MISGKAAMSRSSGNSKPLLHGSDVAGKKSISVTVTGVREAPDNFGAAIILDIEPINGCEAWAVNKTNLKEINEHFFPGDDDPDLEQLEGKTFQLEVQSVRNPSTKRVVPSLVFDPLKQAPRKKGRR